MPRRILPWLLLPKVVFLTALGLVIAAPLLGIVLPPWWAWENQPIENAQAAVLLLGPLHTIFLYQKSANQPKAILLAAIPLWILLVSRDLSFGAVFLDPTSVGTNGPR
ncbi:Hypothetical protein NGAL_HAMBI1146_20330 [Neorhizobium galegae bv. officinalis]|nr:Hypothetical protein NGAL_HAMBI490_18380 [Neorhizobium galegae bv. officinalis]CDZ36800.1 Hypothetical protein NGAL_HAMBI1146_20330 [Neorhizobium galegae bv. officinalis]